MIKNVKRIIAAATTASLVMAVPAAAQTGTVYADILNIRTSPSTSGSIVGTLDWGDTVTITYEPGNGWYEIYTNGSCYYVDGTYIYTEGSSYSSYSDSYTDTSYYDDSSSYSDDSSYYDSYSDSSYYDDGSSYSDDSSYYDSYSDSSYYDDGSSYSDDSSYTDSSYSDSSSGGTYLGTFALTAYCSCSICCGSSGNLTASGTVPTAGRTVAMDGVPFGTQLLINGNVYTVEDRGTSYGTVDIYCSSHSEASAFGLQYAEVYQLS